MQRQGEKPERPLQDKCFVKFCIKQMDLNYNKSHKRNPMRLFRNTISLRFHFFILYLLLLFFLHFFYLLQTDIFLH